MDVGVEVGFGMAVGDDVGVSVADGVSLGVEEGVVGVSVAMVKLSANPPPEERIY